MAYCDPGKNIFRYYVRNEVLPFDEDLTHEFKGHSNVTQNQVPIWSELTKTRVKISRAFCSFLNTGLGGTVYIGVLDNGVVKGIRLTKHKIEHFRQTVDEVLAHYWRPVTKDRYTVKAVPVVGESRTEEDIQERAAFEAQLAENTSLEDKHGPHTTDTSKYCWCDKEAVQRLNSGIIFPQYILEVTIHAWDRNKTDVKDPIGKMNLHPIHQDETGHVYMRCQSSCVEISPREVLEYTDLWVRDHYEPKLRKAMEELRSLDLELAHLPTDEEAEVLKPCPKYVSVTDKVKRQYDLEKKRMTEENKVWEEGSRQEQEKILEGCAKWEEYLKQMKANGSNGDGGTQASSES